MSIAKIIDKQMFELGFIEGEEVGRAKAIDEIWLLVERLAPEEDELLDAIKALRDKDE